MLGKGLGPVEHRAFAGGNGHPPQEACPCIHYTGSPLANGQGLIGDDWICYSGVKQSGAEKPEVVSGAACIDRPHDGI